MRKLVIVALLFASISPALAQFPPPGIYSCIAASGEQFGELTLLVGGDYAFEAVNGPSVSGQLASAGTDINPLTGPLKAMQLIGTFFAEDGRTVLQFVGPQGLTVLCR
jgi:hypothetical protein